MIIWLFFTFFRKYFSSWKRIKVVFLLFLILSFTFIFATSRTKPRDQFRSSHQEVFFEKVVPRNFVKFTGKQLCQRLFFNKVARPTTLLKKSLWHRYFPVNFAKFLRTPSYYRSPPVAAFVNFYEIKSFWSLMIPGFRNYEDVLVISF